MWKPGAMSPSNPPPFSIPHWHWIHRHRKPSVVIRTAFLWSQGTSRSLFFPFYYSFFSTSGLTDANDDVEVFSLGNTIKPKSCASDDNGDKSTAATRLHDRTQIDSVLWYLARRSNNTISRYPSLTSPPTCRIFRMKSSRDNKQKFAKKNEQNDYYDFRIDLISRRIARFSSEPPTLNRHPYLSCLVRDREWQNEKTKSSHRQPFYHISIY